MHKLMHKFNPLSKEHFTLREPTTGIEIPAILVCGAEAGGVCTISAGVHSREYIGIQATLELAEQLNPEYLRGSVLFLPCINYDGFIARTPDIFPYDHKNLNREFPGDTNGTPTQKVAALLEEDVIAHSDYLIDLHSGGFAEGLTPHVYFQGTAAPEVSEQSHALARMVNVPYIVRSSSENGFYGHAGQRGVPAIILERGQLGLMNANEVAQDIADVKNILRGLGFLHDGVEPVLYEPTCIEKGYYTDAPVSGLWYPHVMPGDKITKGQLLGVISSLQGEALHEAQAQASGVVLYMTRTLGIEEGSPLIAYGELS